MADLTTLIRREHRARIGLACSAFINAMLLTAVFALLAFK
jgi:hypothetical protein